ncbi:MAG: CocE/NonD family hydrolase [Candidatus Eisenbacteria bacterium]|nr:CocE/NonD family hydrolase [Candidatus Latescibacterota bacterium]MBD3303336.1 CocE/NonD family hydrolase [Candidatus Eisenbacteria bacterium]
MSGPAIIPAHRIQRADRSALMRIPLLGLLAVLFATLAPSPALGTDYPPVENFRVEMPDGVGLNTDVYFPQDELDPWPVLLYRTPYGIAGDNIGWAADHGYVAVCQDTRGRYGSEGIDRMFRDDGWGPDHTDGLDTVEWILAQPWCNGDVGTLGGSARGITQNALAGALPDSVRCMYVVVAPSDMYAHAVFPGGALRQYDIEGWLTGQGSTHMIDSIYAHPNYDEWWTWGNAKTRHHLETIPTYQVAGWYDLFLQGNIDSFTGLQYGGGDGAIGNQKLLIGPWSHGSMGGGSVGELFYPDAGFATPEALIGTQSEWFLHWLNGIPHDIMDLPPVAYYMMGDGDDPGAPGNEWRAVDAWPPPARPTAFYLRAGGRLDPDPPGSSEAPDVYAYDPLDPVPTLGGGNLILPSGPYDQRPVLERDDVLVYQTDPLETPIEVAGPVEVVLHASSDRLDTDFTAKLCDVYPDGRVMLVCDGIIRARHRNGMDREDQLEPGAVYAFTIDLWSTGIAFNAGHRILLAVSSSNHPRFDANPNTGEPFMEHTTTLVATNAVHHAPGAASHLTLPVLLEPAGAEQETVALPPSGRILSLSATPNPASPLTLIRFALAEPGAVRLDVYDPAGRRVRSVLPTASLPGGRHAARWDGTDDRGHSVPSGTYFLLLEAEGETRSARVMLIR